MHQLFSSTKKNDELYDENRLFSVHVLEFIRVVLYNLNDSIAWFVIVVYFFSCQTDSIAYTFGWMGGVITFALPEQDWPDTKRDQVSLGFITNQSDTVLLRISSGSSSDNIEMELVS